MMNPKVIDVCFCLDKNLFDVLPVVINSIARKNTYNIIRFHIIISTQYKLTSEMREVINYIRTFSNFKVVVYQKTWGKKYQGLGHVTSATMVRLFIPEILKFVKGKVIYLDVDLIVNLDLMELISIDCGETGIAIKNSLMQNWETVWENPNGRLQGNAGVIVMDLRTLRKNNFVEKCLQIHEKSPSRHDQYIINRYADGKHSVLEPRFNIFARQDNHLLKTETDYIFHWAGCTKPYQNQRAGSVNLWHNMEKKVINICFCSDENLVNEIPVVLNSILNKNKHNKIIIHLLHSFEDESKLENLKTYISKHDNLSLNTYYKQWDRKYKGCAKHITNATMLRLYIPEVVKCNKVIYLDIDLIVNLDLYELYKLPVGKTGIALRNSIHEKWERYFSPKSGLKSGNAGVILMNLEVLRKNQFTNKCLQIHEKSNRHDQYVINMYAKGQHKVLEPRFNIFANQDAHLAETETDYIFHWAGRLKPYSNFKKCPKSDLWSSNCKNI